MRTNFFSSWHTRRKKREEQEVGKQDIRSLRRGTPWSRSAFWLSGLSALPNFVLILSLLSSCIISPNCSHSVYWKISDYNKKYKCNSMIIELKFAVWIIFDKKMSHVACRKRGCIVILLTIPKWCSFFLDLL